MTLEICAAEGFIGSALQFYGSRIPEHPFKGRILRSVACLFFPNGMMFSTTHGIKFHLPSGESFAQMLLKRRGYETETLELCIRLMGGVGIFVDIGANFGLYSCILARQTQGKVLAVEPFPPNLKQLHNSIFLNEIENIIVCPYAVGETNGRIEIGCDEPQNPGVARHLPGHSSAMEVTLKKLDDLLKEENIQDVKLLKVDVEGAELQVFRGLDLTSRRRPRYVIMEFYANHPSSHAAHAYLCKAGFEAFDIRGNPIPMGHSHEVPDHNLIFSDCRL